MEQKLFINGAIDWWADSYKNEIWNAQPESMKVYIDSPGGSVTDGNSIAGLLRMHANSYAVDVETCGIGLVASIATMVLLAGTKVGMDKNALLMIHNPRAEWVSGESKDLRQIATTLDVIKSQLANAYVDRIEKSGKLVDGDKQKTKNLVLQYMAAETWFTAQEALEFGLIDFVAECDEEKEQMANLNEQMPEDGMQRAANTVNAYTDKQQFLNFFTKTDTDMELNKEEKGFISRLFAFFKNSETAQQVEDVQEETPQAETPKDDLATLKAELEALKSENEALKAEKQAIEAAKEAQENELKAAHEDVVKLQAKQETGKPVVKNTTDLPAYLKNAQFFQ